jgi:cobalt-zinc-cadmium efflux system outer membrane protein
MIDPNSIRFRDLLIGVAFILGSAPVVAAQDAAIPVSRTAAVEQALTRGARLALARADTAAAGAALIGARALENPTVTGTYSKATPQWHVLMDLPLAYPWIRVARIGAAKAGRQAAGYRFAFERAAAALDADTTYTRALAAREHRRLSRRTAQDADSLLRMARQRLAAGDAAQLDLELALVNAGQQASIAATDSLDYLSTVLDVQAAMGMQYRDVAITLTDSLTLPPDSVLMSDSLAPVGVLPRAISPGDSTNRAAVGVPSASTPVASTAPLQVAAAEAALRGAAMATSAERRSVWLAPTLTVGFETGDPSGGEPGILPTLGIGLPLPLFNRNAGPLASARAEQARAEAELQLARVESQTAIARGQRQLAIALSKVRRDRVLVTAADRVAAMSLTAYREGASTLPNVLEAQRNARDVFAQYVDDLADAWNASATLRVLTLTP